MGKLIFILTTVWCVVFMGACKVKGGGISTTVTERVKETYRDTSITVKGESVSTLLDSNFVALLMARLQNEDTVFIPSPGGQTVLKYYLNDKGELNTECASKDRFIEFLIREVDRYREDKTEQTIQEKQPWWPILIIGIESAFILVLLIKVLIGK